MFPDLPYVNNCSNSILSFCSKDCSYSSSMCQFSAWDSEKFSYWNIFLSCKTNEKVQIYLIFFPIRYFFPWSPYMNVIVPIPVLNIVEDYVLNLVLPEGMEEKASGQNWFNVLQVQAKHYNMDMYPKVLLPPTPYKAWPLNNRWG